MDEAHRPVEVVDLGDVMTETKQTVTFPIIPDFYYGWGDWY